MSLNNAKAYGILGACGGMGELMASTGCVGGVCHACFGCIGLGMLIVATVLVKRITAKRDREVNDGLAQADH